MEGMGQLMPGLMEELDIEMVVPPVHLDPGHRSVSVVNAPTIEAVTQLVYQTGFSQWNTVEVCPTTPVQELMEKVEEFPIVYE